MQIKKMLIVLALTILVFGPISSQAFTVEIDSSGTNALGIRNLEVDSVLYNVAFRYGSSNDIYGAPPDLLFEGEDASAVATAAVNTALNSEDSVRTVGPQTSELYNIGAGVDINYPQFLMAFTSAYDDRTPFEWDIAKAKDEGLLGVNIIGLDVLATYADFNPVPIPAAGWLLGGGLIGLLGLRRRFKS